MPRFATWAATPEIFAFVRELVRTGARLGSPQKTDVARAREIVAARKRPRKPGIATLVKRAEKTGKTVTSVTTPDGTTINFGNPEPSEANNPWLADIGKVTKQ
jgi:hypothetical protein